MESLLFPVAVAHRMITIQFGFSFLKSEISVLASKTISFISIGCVLGINSVGNFILCYIL
ncbi:hypothetical protein KKG31_06830 [Patescibacteria group bacterium]|nr:hypothetical protein [Patescibacteria group bacterium]